MTPVSADVPTQEEIDMSDEKDPNSGYSPDPNDPINALGARALEDFVLEFGDPNFTTKLQRLVNHQNGDLGGPPVSRTGWFRDYAALAVS